MRIFMYAAAAALAVGTAAPQLNAQATSSPDAKARLASGVADPDGRQQQWDPNGPGTPPGDGITRLGHDPKGQSFTPMGYNQGIGVAVYPPVTLAPPGLIGGDYPVCSARVTDRCLQAYTQMARR